MAGPGVHFSVVFSVCACQQRQLAQQSRRTCYHAASAEKRTNGRTLRISKLGKVIRAYCSDLSTTLPLGVVYKLRLQDKVGKWLSKCQQMSTGVGSRTRWSVLTSDAAYFVVAIVIGILSPFLVIFLPTTLLSFTKLRFKPSF